MIANTLIFLLGMLVTALAVMILSPIVWRKAQSLARREFEATVPISANEIRAEFDRVRAEAAVAVRRQEVLSTETRAKTAKAQAEAGRLVVENADLRKQGRQLVLTLEDQDRELADLRAALGAQGEDNQRLSSELGQVRHAAELKSEELEALGKRFRELAAIAEERKIELLALEAKVERMADRLRLTSREDREEGALAEKLTAETSALERSLRQERAASATLQDKVASLVGRLADRDEEIARLSGTAPADAAFPAPASAFPASTSANRSRSLWTGPKSGEPARATATMGRRELPALDAEEEADIRERISDVAARVIRMTALAEGPTSPLAALLDPGTPAGTPPGAKPTLADRVRLLAEAERKTGS